MNNMLRLHLNENLAGPDRKILRLLSNQLIRINEYTDEKDYKSVQKLLARYCRLKKENILITNGARQIMDLILNGFNIKNSDILLIPVPTYYFYKKYESLKSFVIKKVLYNQNFLLDINKIIDIVNNYKIRGIYLANPANPLGTKIPKKELFKLVSCLQKKGAFLILDETYYEFCKLSGINFIKTFPNLIILRTLSKSFGLAGLRMGYIVSNKNTIDLLDSISNHKSISKIGLIATKFALENKNYVKKYIKEVNRSKKYIGKIFRKYGIIHYDSAANFIIIRVKNSRKIVKQLKCHNVQVLDLNDYPDNNGLLKNCIRITIGPMSKMRPLFTFLRKNHVEFLG